MAICHIDQSNLSNCNDINGEVDENIYFHQTKQKIDNVINFSSEDDKENIHVHYDQNSNMYDSDTENKRPDVNILIDMDVVNKNAVFIIEMPDSWDTKVYSRFKSEDNQMQEVEVNNCTDLDPSDNYQRNSDRLNVEIEMLLCKENLTKSEISANLNSIPVNVGSIKSDNEDQYPKNEFNNIQLEFENSSDNFEVNSEIKVLPIIFNEQRVERQTFQFESNSKNDMSSESTSKRFDFRWKPFPDRKKSMDIDDSTESRKYKFWDQLPKLELPSICVKEIKSDSGLETEVEQEKSSNFENKNNRNYFSFKLQKFGFSSLSKKRKLSISENTNCSPKTSIFPKFEFRKRRSTADADADKFHNSNIETERFDFRYKLPKLELPTIDFQRKIFHSDTNVDDRVKNENNEGGTERFDFRYKLPKIELAIFGNKNKYPKIDEEQMVSNERPIFQFQSKISSAEPDGNIENHSERFDFRYKLPKLDFTFFRSKENSPNVDTEATFSADYNMTQSDTMVNAENNPDRFDFRYQLPKINLPEFSIPQRSSSINRNITNESSINDHQERFDFSYKLPKVDLPLFSTKLKEPNLIENDNVNFESSDLEVHTENNPERFDFRYQLPKISLPELPIPRRSSSVRKIDASESNADEHPERFDFRFKLPKLDLPYFDTKVKEPYLNENGNIEVNSSTNLGASDEVVQAESNPLRFDFRYQLPKIEMPAFTFPEWPPTTDDDKEGEVNLENRQERFDFRYQLPKIDFPDLSIPRRLSTSDKNVNDNVRIEGHPERFDFRYQLPKIDLPLIHFSEKSPSLIKEAELQQQSTDSDVNYYFELPKINLSSFSFKARPNTTDFKLTYDVNSDPFLSSLVDDFDFNDVDKYHTLPTVSDHFPESSENRPKRSYINLSRKITNPFAQIYLDNINAKRLKSPEDIDTESYFSLNASKPKDIDWSNDKYHFVSVDEELESSFIASAYADPNSIYIDDHSDIDLFPSPYRVINLPHFSPLVSVNSVPIFSSSESDVGSFLTFNKKEQHQIRNNFKNPTSEIYR